MSDSRARSIHPKRLTLAWLVLLGGVAVIGSYAYSLGIDPATRAGLWGSVPRALLPGYTASMALTAAGFFAYTFFLLVHVDPNKARIAGRLRYSLFRGPSRSGGAEPEAVQGGRPTAPASRLPAAPSAGDRRPHPAQDWRPSPRRCLRPARRYHRRGDGPGRREGRPTPGRSDPGVGPGRRARLPPGDGGPSRCREQNPAGSTRPSASLRRSFPSPLEPGPTCRRARS